MREKITKLYYCAQKFYLLSETDGKNCTERLEAMVEKAPMSTCNDYKGRLLICLYFTCYSLLSRSNVLLSKLDFVQGSWPLLSIKQMGERKSRGKTHT